MNNIILGIILLIVISVYAFNASSFAGATAKAAEGGAAVPFVPTDGTDAQVVYPVDESADAAPCLPARSSSSPQGVFRALPLADRFPGKEAVIMGNGQTALIPVVGQSTSRWRWPSLEQWPKLRSILWSQPCPPASPAGCRRCR